MRQLTALPRRLAVALMAVGAVLAGALSSLVLALGALVAPLLGAVAVVLAPLRALARWLRGAT